MTKGLESNVEKVSRNWKKADKMVNIKEHWTNLIFSTLEFFPRPECIFEVQKGDSDRVSKLNIVRVTVVVW